MIPILYEKDETAFVSNGLGRLYDCTSCVVAEERNGIYECDFEYPIDGANFDKITLGRIIGVEHDESSDVQPFDIVSYTRPINGVVTFHCTHISYRLTKATVSGKNISSLAAAFTQLGTAQPSNPFTYETDKTSTGFVAAFDGVPRSVRQMLGGIEGSILDTFGGEYEFDKFTVHLWTARGEDRSLTIRYGVNMLDYQDETDYSESFTACVPYWTGQNDKGADIVVKGSMVSSSGTSASGRVECIPLDLTDKFEEKPTASALQTEAANYMALNQVYLPAKTIKVDFVRLTDSTEYQQFANLQACKLCDTVRVVFPNYNQIGTFKIVKTEYDVLQERYTELELGSLSTSLSEALGISSGLGGSNTGVSGLDVLDNMSADGTTTIFDGPIIINGHNSAIGSINSGGSVSGSRSISSGTSFVQLGNNITLPAGTWILIGRAEFQSNTSGRRAITWYNMDASPVEAIEVTNINQLPVSGAGTRLQSVYIIALSAERTFQLRAAQNSGSSLNTSYYYYAIRIA